MKFDPARSAAVILGVLAAVLALLHASMLHAQSKDLPNPDAQALWSYLQKQDYRKTFKLFPGKGKLYKGTEPHDALLTTYVNAPAHAALSKKTDRLPEGSIIVKENYTPDKKLAATTVMYKAAGYDPEHNNWFWLKRSGDKVDAAGKVEGCIACHGSSKRDYIMTPVKK